MVLSKKKKVRKKPNSLIWIWLLKPGKLGQAGGGALILLRRDKNKIIWQDIKSFFTSPLSIIMLEEPWCLMPGDKDKLFLVVSGPTFKPLRRAVGDELQGATVVTWQTICLMYYSYMFHVKGTLEGLMQRMTGKQGLLANLVSSCQADGGFVWKPTRLSSHQHIFLSPKRNHVAAVKKEHATTKQRCSVWEDENPTTVQNVLFFPPESIKSWSLPFISPSRCCYRSRWAITATARVTRSLFLPFLLCKIFHCKNKQMKKPNPKHQKKTNQKTISVLLRLLERRHRKPSRDPGVQSVYLFWTCVLSSVCVRVCVCVWHQTDALGGGRVWVGLAVWVSPAATTQTWC